MPFDTTQPVTEQAVSLTARLAQIGIIPVPEEQWRDYMDEVRRRYCHRARARWCTLDVNHNNLRSQLRQFRSPERVIGLAERVRQHLPDARFQVKSFYTDPLLFVEWYDRDALYPPSFYTACLGIWDRGKLIAIAEPPRKGFFARLFG